jgi:hypothetical protein
MLLSPGFETAQARENMGLPKEKPSKPAFEEGFFRQVFSHRLGETSLAVYLHQQELVGARWILELPISSWNATILQHAKEEMKHTEIMHAEAARFRNQLPPPLALQMNRIGATIFEATETYMSTIFKDSLKAVVRAHTIKGDHKRLANYYLLSLLLERRIMKTYPYIAHLASDIRFIEAAKRIIMDERGHLTEIMAGVEAHVTPHGVKLPPAYAAEELAYKNFMRAYLDALHAAEPHLIGAL